MFTDSDIIFMKALGINANFDNPSDDDLVEIEDKVSEKLMKFGFDKDYDITRIGKKCEGILDKLP